MNKDSNIQTAMLLLPLANILKLLSMETGMFQESALAQMLEWGGVLGHQFNTL